MTEYGLNVFNDMANTRSNLILSYNSLSLSGSSQKIAFFTDHIRIDDTTNINYTDIATVSQIPTTTGELTNDSGFITSAALTGYATETWVEQKGYLTSVAWGDITDKPTLATVATSGSYNDLIDKPTIPAAQVNSDWNASSGVAQILNKPTLATVATSGSYNDLIDKPTIPTDNNQLANGAGYQTASDVSTAISSQTKETWTFTLADGSTVTKSVVLGA